MNRGDWVTVIAFGGKQLERRVWAEYEEGCLLCTDIEYRRAVQAGEDARGVGFPKEDITEVRRDGSRSLP